MDPATDAARYPEHAKLNDSRDRYEPVKMFVRWLKSEGVILGRPYSAGVMEQGSSGVTEVTDAEALVFRFVGIDAAKIEQERRSMVDDYRLARTSDDKGA